MVLSNALRGKYEFYHLYRLDNGHHRVVHGSLLVCNIVYRDDSNLGRKMGGIKRSGKLSVLSNIPLAEKAGETLV
jgi:hypothetical protein